VTLPAEAVAHLMKDAEKGANARIMIDLPAQTVTAADGTVFAFDIDPFKKHCLVNGLDDIGLSLEKVSAIDAYEAQARTQRPWL
jgi:3-isopropylmalate/(R)-2-methylmalate dehydratase small subunit